MECYQIDDIAREFDALGIKHGAKDKIMPYMEAMKNYHRPTFEHSVRVAGLGKKIAEFTHIVEPKALWLPGLIHDLGKFKIPQESLNKTVGWDRKDAEMMKKHVEFGCMLLSGIADFSALTTFYTHYFKKEDSYPSEKDFVRIFGTTYDSWSEAGKTKAKYCGRIVSVADIKDALHRENDKFSPGEAKSMPPEKAKAILLESNDDQKYLIEQLYAERIFV